MAKAAYIGVGSVAKKIKKMYIGIDGVARKVKKAYIGVAGVARLFWSGMGELKRYGNATGLSTGVWATSAATVGNYALFAGGVKDDDARSSDYVATVNTYDTSLTKGTATALATGRARMAGASVGNYALFAGGHKTTTEYATIRSYDTALTVNDSISSFTQTAMLASSTTIGGYALFGGGAGSWSNSSGLSSYRKKVFAYNTSLTRSELDELTNSGVYHGATTVGNYALFGGGYNGTTKYEVDTYNASLTKGSATSLLSGGYKLATTVGDYAVFLGTNNGSDTKLSVVAYTPTLTQIIATDTPVWIAPQKTATTTVGDCAIFAPYNASSNNGTKAKNVLVYDSSLTQRTTDDLSVEYNAHPAAITIGNYALFGGGMKPTGEGYTNVEVYQVD